MSVLTEVKKAEKIKAASYMTYDLLQIKVEENFYNAVDKLKNEIDDIHNKNIFTKTETKPFYYFKAGNFYIADISQFDYVNNTNFPSEVAGFPTSALLYEGFAKLVPYVDKCPIFEDVDNYWRIKDKNNNYYMNYVTQSGSNWYDYYIYSNKASGSNGYYSSISKWDLNRLRLPVSYGYSFKNAIVYELMPEGLSKEGRQAFEMLVEFNKNGWVEFNDEKESLTEDFYDEFICLSVKDYGDIKLSWGSVKEQLKKEGAVVENESEFAEKLIENLVNSDKERIDLTPYEKNRLTDPNGGHWELWTEKIPDEQIAVDVSSLSLYARNPVCDVQYDAYIGIDFGTKGTVVTFQNGNDNTMPMRIGSGKYEKTVEPKDYENPTVIEFINIKKFLKNYGESESRPKTSWSDLTVSHTANMNLNDMQTGDSYNAWMRDLKQWAGDKNRQIIIKDKEGTEITLPPFTEIRSSEFDPIEIYAYMLGLFINNMYNKIYINYILSFPVTYERRIRQKVAESFEKGLKKSLPEAVLDDSGVMSLFRVTEGSSEPAAYAVCALKGYGFKPKENEKILYGIFDFGGGTTDFDFGIWKAAEKKGRISRYDYVIKHFGAGGDRTLGGENIIEMLAYNIFCNNQDILRENKIQFMKPSECEIIPGTETLVNNNSQQAKINLHMLAEKIRPLWEGRESEELNGKTVKLNLYSSEDKLAVTVELNIDSEKLKEMIRLRIDKGVENFFEAMKSAFTDEIAKGVDRIHIFLAGNSSKSKAVSESFAFYEKKYEKIFADKLNIDADKLKSEKVTEKKSECDYFVKKYDNANALVKYYIEDFGDNADTINLFKNDEFVNKLPIDRLYDLFCDFSFVDKNTAVLRNDLYKLWEEGLFPASRMKEMFDYITEYLEENWDDADEEDEIIADFIYSNAETDDETRELIEEAYENFEIIEEIKKKTEKHLVEAEIAEYKSTVFELYPPLGTEQADAICREKGIEVSDSIIRPTGKTGVAYGLLETRPGSRIKVESEIKSTDEVKFNFFTGYNNDGKFEVITDRNIKYNEWTELIDAGEADFELYYTDLPEAVTNSMPISQVRKKVCRIDETMDDAMIYIRAVEPSVMEYAAAFGKEELEKQEYLSAPKKIILG